MGNFPARSPNGSPVGLVQEPEDGSANKLAVILDAARYQSSDLQGEIVPEPVSFFPIERIGATPDNDPGSLEDGQQTNVKFSVPSLSLGLLATDPRRPWRRASAGLLSPLRFSL